MRWSDIWAVLNSKYVVAMPTTIKLDKVDGLKSFFEYLQRKIAKFKKKVGWCELLYIYTMYCVCIHTNAKLISLDSKKMIYLR